MKKIFELLGSSVVRAAFVLLIGLLKSILNAVAQLRDLLDNGQLDDSADNELLNRIIVILDQIGSTSLLAWSDLSQIIELFKKEHPDTDGKS